MRFHLAQLYTVNALSVAYGIFNLYTASHIPSLHSLRDSKGTQAIYTGNILCIYNSDLITCFPHLLIPD